MELFRIDPSYIDNDFKQSSSAKYEDNNQINGAGENRFACGRFGTFRRRFKWTFKHHIKNILNDILNDIFMFF